jgi:hypothetical protein
MGEGATHHEGIALTGQLGCGGSAAEFLRTHTPGDKHGEEGAKCSREQGVPRTGGVPRV